MYTVMFKPSVLEYHTVRYNNP